MLRANRPWRLALRLMRALAVACAAGVFALVTSDICRLSHHLRPVRLTLFAIMLAAALLLVPGNLLGLVLVHPADVAD